MLDVSQIAQYLVPLQWLAAIVFVPLVSWQFCSRKSISCRWVSMLSAYAVQIGFFLLLDDVGFQVSLLILISSVAAYFWITTTVALWPAPKIKQSLPQTETVETATQQEAA